MPPRFPTARLLTSTRPHRLLPLLSPLPSASLSPAPRALRLPPPLLHRGARLRPLPRGMASAAAAAEAPPVGVGGEGAAAPRRLALEELPWDHSFVRELPGDPRSDAIPREVPAGLLLPLRSLLAALD